MIIIIVIIVKGIVIIKIDDQIFIWLESFVDPFIKYAGVMSNEGVMQKLWMTSMNFLIMYLAIKCSSKLPFDQAEQASRY